MRIGPLDFSIHRFAEKKPRPPLGETGTSGLNIWRGLVAEEYNPDLRGPAAYETYDKMLRGDGQVQAVELAIWLPIGAAAWSVEPGDDSAASREAADLILSNLFGGMTISFAEVLRHALLGALTGVALLEHVWEIRDGLAAWRKLAPRAPKSIRQWDMDIGGGVQGVVQWARDEGGGFRDVRIPIEKLIRLTWRGDYGNPEGRALLRPAYKHWFTKDWLYKFANIAVERGAVGVPVGHLPEGYSKTDQDDFLDLLKDWKASESSAFALPPGYTIELLQMQVRSQGFMALIEHHDVMIARSVLAQFINLGTTASGSRALSEGQTGFFILALNTVADWFAEHINRYGIPRWCAYNYPGLKALPTLGHSSIGTVLDPGGIANGLAQLCAGRLLTPDDDLENVVRGWFGLPPLPEEHTRATEQPIERPVVAHGAQPLSAVVRGSTRRYDPEPHLAAGRQMAADEQRFEAAMAEVVTDQEQRLLAKLEPIIADFKAAPDEEKGRQISRMQAVNVPLVAKYENLLRGWLWSLFSVARERAAAEFGAKPGAVTSAMRQWIAAKAQVLAQDHSEKLRAQVLHELLDVIRQDLPTGDILKVLGQAARGRARVDLTDGLREAGEQLIEVINNALIGIQTRPGAQALPPVDV